MARRYKYCVNCRRTITDSEMDRGLFILSERGVLCATCAQRLDEASREKGVEPAVAEAPLPADETPEAVAPASGANEQLKEIGRQIEDIRRTMLFEKSSAWNLTAVLAQSLAVAIFLIAIFRWLDNPANLLLAAIFFQIMAMTFFVKARL